MRAALLGGSGSVSVEGCSGLPLSQLENVLPGSLTLLAGGFRSSTNRPLH